LSLLELLIKAIAHNKVIIGEMITENNYGKCSVKKISEAIEQIRGFTLLDAPMSRAKPLTENYVHK
jgi:hypothetical protein